MNLAHHKYIRTPGGSALIVSLLVLVLLTLLGLAITNTAQIEMGTAGNQKFHALAFYKADSVIYPAARIVSVTVSDSTAPTFSQEDNNGNEITYVPNDGNFLNEVMGFNPHDFNEDLRFAFGDSAVNVDVWRIGERHLAGGGIEFSSGAEGVGVSSVGILYRLTSTASSGQAKAESVVSSRYQKVLVPGGL